MEQKPKSIYEFRKGDVVTRLKPLVDDELGKDFSLVGASLTFLGIANACVYLSKKADFITKLFLGQEDIQIKLPLEICEQGWANYVEPDFIDGISSEKSPKEELEREIEKAVKREDYVKADLLKKKLEDLLKSGGNG
jgi:hypothetical protein